MNNYHASDGVELCMLPEMPVETRGDAHHFIASYLYSDIVA
jgi:hypothetical protein